MGECPQNPKKNGIREENLKLEGKIADLEDRTEKKQRTTMMNSIQDRSRMQPENEGILAKKNVYLEKKCSGDCNLYDSIYDCKYTKTKTNVNTPLSRIPLSYNFQNRRSFLGRLQH